MPDQHARAERALSDGSPLRGAWRTLPPTSEDFEPADLSSYASSPLTISACSPSFFHFVRTSKDHLCSGTPRIFEDIGAGRHGHDARYQWELNHASLPQFSLSGLGRVDQVKDEDADDEGAESVRRTCLGPSGARAASTACWGLFA